jgi:hypothetical protein
MRNREGERDRLLYAGQESSRELERNEREGNEPIGKGASESLQDWVRKEVLLLFTVDEEILRKGKWFVILRKRLWASVREKGKKMERKRQGSREQRSQIRKIKVKPLLVMKKEKERIAFELNSDFLCSTLCNNCASHELSKF